MTIIHSRFPPERSSSFGGFSATMREREPLHPLLVVMRVTVVNSNSLYPIVVGEEGSMSCSVGNDDALVQGNMKIIKIVIEICKHTKHTNSLKISHT